MKMKRLLNINNYHYRRGGSDVVYLEHAALMEKLGWKNAFFSMTHPMNLPCPWSKFFVDEIEFGNSYTLSRKITMAMKVVYSLEARTKLTRLISEFPADIAHLHCIYHHLSPSIFSVLTKAGIPIVMTAHDLKLVCPAYKMLNEGGICERCNHGSVLNVIRHKCIRNNAMASTIVAAETFVHRLLQTYRHHLSKVIVPSQFFISKFVQWGWPRDRFEYIPNYVECESFDPEYQPGNYFLYFGRLAPEKGIATLIRAASMASVRLRIAGTGPEAGNLQLLAASLGADIEFLGYQSGGALRKIVSGARAVVLPSEWFENAPMAILESYAMGKPVIGADIGGIPEMIRRNETGWLYESGNMHELAALLARVHAMPDIAIGEMGRMARELTRDRFSRNSYADACLRLYASLGMEHRAVRQIEQEDPEAAGNSG
jgi:glycosyltransferase involved in cell wall biosynthesis